MLYLFTVSVSECGKPCPVNLYQFESFFCKKHAVSLYIIFLLRYHGIEKEASAFHAVSPQSVMLKNKLYGLFVISRILHIQKILIRLIDIPAHIDIPVSISNVVWYVSPCIYIIVIQVVVFLPVKLRNCLTAASCIYSFHGCLYSQCFQFLLYILCRTFKCILLILISFSKCKNNIGISAFFDADR